MYLITSGCNGVFLEKTHYSLATKSHSGFAFQFEAHAVSCMASILQFGTSILWIYIILSYIYMDLFVKTSYRFYWWLLTTSHIVLVMNFLSRLLTPCIASVESERITWSSIVLNWYGLSVTWPRGSIHTYYQSYGFRDEGAPAPAVLG